MRRTVWLARGAWGMMEGLGTNSHPNETGGLLLGYVADRGDVVVKAIVGPGPKARHFRHRFVPDVEYQQSALEAHHFATLGQESYLGDWHTHPDSSAVLSCRDKKTLRNIAAEPKAYVAKPLMAILFGGRYTWGIAAVRLEGWKKRLLLYSHDITTLDVRFFD
jgi:integrative and conjugative element protein (TIGR02256 family)